MYCSGDLIILVRTPVIVMMIIDTLLPLEENYPVILFDCEYVVIGIGRRETIVVLKHHRWLMGEYQNYGKTRPEEHDDIGNVITK